MEVKDQMKDAFSEENWDLTAEDCDTVKMHKFSVNAENLKLSSTKEVIKTLQ